MLHKDSMIIAPETFTLIQQLQTILEFNDFKLGGGIALALQLGHRTSIDLFTQNSFEYFQIISLLESRFNYRVIFVRTNTIICFINNIKVDFISHPYPYVLPPITEEGITFLSKQDIAAMKLNAIVNSGQRIKDFIDVYVLLTEFSLNQMLGFYTNKYPNSNAVSAIKALNYFDDIDEAIDPPKMLKPLPLKNIKQRIQQATLHADKIFSE
ncbi:MAG: nucleotidyl transferase AbiEii/AbiGii toxin family protein [Chitinophagales bacterium]|nr:nucleotidyl transferase AbiEii/AbiGii toxin family protein [Bacteroidota bacterium]MBP7399599.1 nucleotidyl transferase AbiEii/AbiGii toxin family protein [Chitinophagales bacterium]MBK8488516.1 nucleotidyl transferase AbiEii/AbiGii toxin family protein [Bacteroidota bacterium]MBK8681721.1 nucleotidyl transferase AbiEii/AbiGii toxin family protein [Bacteroidota bacterium]MBP8754286.1 nucleotidyl transferase AbiEii/AbiGii toxin family protein [Chitinophagales bacterium]